MSTVMARYRREVELQRLEADVKRQLGATHHWPFVNSPDDLEALARVGYRGSYIIGPHYSLSPAARECAETIDRLLER